mmetsp:Transcript_104772/g.302269  ORF Transcript_104772/g.302269 Transcript_104772/m.302269 type:complete len:105 (+) Transcript_104772:928-1242(+)
MMGGSSRRLIGDWQVSRTGFKSLLQDIDPFDAPHNKEYDETPELHLVRKSLLYLVRKSLGSAWVDKTTLGEVLPCAAQSNVSLTKAVLCYCHVEQVSVWRLWLG